MSGGEVLVEAGQLGGINDSIASGLLGSPANTAKETAPRKKSSKHSHKKRLTAAERLALCKITDNLVILSVEPDARHKSRSRRVRTYHTYEEYLEAKRKALENRAPGDPEESDIVSLSEFNMSDDSEAFENIQIEEKSLLEAQLLEEKKCLADEELEKLSQPIFLVNIAPNRDFCYDNNSAAVDRGMPGNPLEKEIEEQEAREQKELEDDIQYRNSMLYPESPLANHLELNFASDIIRNEFGINTTLDESAFSVSEINAGIISLSPGSPRGVQKTRCICSSGVITLLSVNPDAEKIAAYQDKTKNTKRVTHVRRYRTTDKTNELNESLGTMPGAISNVKLESKSTNFPEEGNEAEEEKIKSSENTELRDAINEEKENNHVFEGRGMSYSNNGLTHEYSDLTIYSDEEKMKSSECERLDKDLKEEHKEEVAEQRREYEEAKMNLPEVPPADIIDNEDGTFDVGIQAIRCDIDEILNRRPRKNKKFGVPYADYAAFAIQPRVLVNIDENRNACYDNMKDAIDRGMPGNPLEDEIEEREAIEEKEREDDYNYYLSTLYHENAIHVELRASADSDILRAEFGNRPEEPKIEEEEEENDQASSENSEADISPPPLDTLSSSPRVRRRVKKPVRKSADTQCEIIHVEPLENLRLPSEVMAEKQVSNEPLSNNDENNNEDNDDNNENDNNNNDNNDENGILQKHINDIVVVMADSDNDNAASSERSDGRSNLPNLSTIPQILMPSGDSSCISPRSRSPRSARTSSRNAYRPLNGNYMSPRYNTRPLDASSPSINRLKERALKLEPIANATNEQLELLINEIEQERKIMMRDRRFKDGLKCNAAIKHVEAILSKQQQEQASPSPETQMEMALDTESKRREANILEKQEVAKRKLKAKHRKELNNFDKQWNSRQMPDKYAMPSQKLIAMEERYNAMIAAENPDEAEELNKLKEEIDELRHLETAEAHQKMQNDYDRELYQLHIKHHQDFTLLSETNKFKINQFKQQKAKDKRALTFKIAELNNNESPIAGNPNNEIMGAQSERFESDALSNLFDQSDVQKIEDTRNVEKLNLPPLDTRKSTILKFASHDSS